MQIHAVVYTALIMECDWFYQVYSEFLNQGMVILLLFFSFFYT